MNENYDKSKEKKKRKEPNRNFIGRDWKKFVVGKKTYGNEIKENERNNNSKKKKRSKRKT